MAERNMWGDFKDVEKIKTPAVYLREQADILSKNTNSVLMGEVTSEVSPSGRFRVELDIMVPTLNNYRYTVVTIRHGLKIYPINITDNTNSLVFECKDEEQFLSKLEPILSSPGIKRVISTLIAQSST